MWAKHKLIERNIRRSVHYIYVFSKSRKIELQCAVVQIFQKLLKCQFFDNLRTSGCFCSPEFSSSVDITFHLRFALEWKLLRRETFRPVFICSSSASESGNVRCGQGGTATTSCISTECSFFSRLPKTLYRSINWSASPSQSSIQCSYTSWQEMQLLLIHASKDSISRVRIIIKEKYSGLVTERVSVISFSMITAHKIKVHREPRKCLVISFRLSCINILA